MQDLSKAVNDQMIWRPSIHKGWNKSEETWQNLGHVHMTYIYLIIFILNMFKLPLSQTVRTTAGLYVYICILIIRLFIRHVSYSSESINTIWNNYQCVNEESYCLLRSELINCVNTHIIIHNTLTLPATSKHIPWQQSQCWRYEYTISHTVSMGRFSTVWNNHLRLHWALRLLFFYAHHEGFLITGNTAVEKNMIYTSSITSSFWQGAVSFRSVIWCPGKLDKAIFSLVAL